MTCNCHSCIEKHHIQDEYGLPLSMVMMIICPICGNKRCPKASNHELDCTDSNDTGQEGSIYVRSNIVIRTEVKS